MVQFAGWEMPLVYEGTHKNRVAGGAGKSIIHSIRALVEWLAGSESSGDGVGDESFFGAVLMSYRQ